MSDVTSWEPDPADEMQCASTRTVHMGALSATDLRCILKKWEHAEPLHFTARSFGDVVMKAEWFGEFEEPE